MSVDRSKPHNSVLPVRGVPEDVVSYSMLREEWLAGGLAGAAVEIVGRIPRRFFPT